MLVSIRGHCGSKIIGAPFDAKIIKHLNLTIYRSVLQSINKQQYISIYLFVITVDSLLFGSASGWLGHLRLKDDSYSALKC